jgi:hypothetical protein
MTKSELGELNASEMEAISGGLTARRGGLGGLIVLLLLALLLRRTAALLSGW